MKSLNLVSFLLKYTVLLFITVCFSDCNKEGDGLIPSVTETTLVTNITQTSATSGGIVPDEGGSKISARGVCWNTTSNPTVANDHCNSGVGRGVFLSEISGLEPNTIYFLRAYATNDGGTAYGNELAFTTLSPAAPTVSTENVTEITPTTVKTGGSVISDGGTDVIAKGVCWSESGDPTITDAHTIDGSGEGAFISNLNGLISGTSYYLRAYATTKLGTGYGTKHQFTTVMGVIDIDGNFYNAIKIGTQVWMRDNLKVTHYRNGDSIPNVTEGDVWSNLNSGAYCWYNNNESGFGADFGALYNFYSVVDSRNLCPTGWHIPSKGELETMHEFLGVYAGGKMKERGTLHWRDPNRGATNESGFTSLPGGSRSETGVFDWAGFYGDYWLSDENSVPQTALLYEQNWFTSGSGIFYYYQKSGNSVRCIRD